MAGLQLRATSNVLSALLLNVSTVGDFLVFLIVLAVCFNLGHDSLRYESILLSIIHRWSNNRTL